MHDACEVSKTLSAYQDTSVRTQGGRRPCSKYVLQGIKSQTRAGSKSRTWHQQHKPTAWTDTCGHLHVSKHCWLTSSALAVLGVQLCSDSVSVAEHFDTATASEY